MATPKTETGHAAGFIISEANGHRSRENVTLVGSSGNIKAGQVLSKLTSGSDSGLYTPFNQDGSDGSENAFGISINDVDENTAATQSIAIIARDAEVNADELVWPADITDAEKAAGVVELEALGIQVR